MAGDYSGFKKFGEKILNDVEKEMILEMPKGYTIEKTNNRWSRKSNDLRYVALAIMLTIIAYFICSILFENLMQAFYIILVTPFSYIGVFLVFLLFDFYLDQGIYAAFVLLGGLVINASIFIINDLKQLKSNNHNENVITAISGKAIPIILTVISTCIGLLPFVLSGQNEVFWFSLSVSIIGGLLFSLIIVFFLLPLILLKKHSEIIWK